MPAKDLADRKRSLVTDLNNFIAKKKQFTDNVQGRNELLNGAAADGGEAEMAGAALVHLLAVARVYCLTHRPVGRHGRVMLHVLCAL